MKHLPSLIFSIFIAHTAFAADKCSTLDRDHCFASKECTVDCASPPKDNRCEPYVCKPKELCEMGIAQTELNQENCEKREGCTWTRPNCYCPENLLCRCGGGAPAHCVLK